MLLAILASQGACGRGEASASPGDGTGAGADSEAEPAGEGRPGSGPVIGQRCEVLLRFDVLAERDRPAIDPHVPFFGRSPAGETAGILGVLESVDEHWVVVLRQVEGERHRFHIPRSHVLLIRTW